jgi:uncharacterized membrane protein (UPF0127 family)
MGFVRRVHGGLVANEVSRVSSFAQRLFGLLGRSELAPNEGLWFDCCSAIHTLGMRVAIDVIFVDARYMVVQVNPDVRPGCWYLGCARSRGVIELGIGALAQAEVVVGDVLEFIPSAL